MSIHADFEVPFIKTLKLKFEQMDDFLNERSRRIWCASEVKAYGRGGLKLVHMATGISQTTIIRGLKELEQIDQEKNTKKSELSKHKSEKSINLLDASKIRHQGGGRRKLHDKYPNLMKDLDNLIEPVTRGDPENPLRWSSKSTIKLAEALKEKNYDITQRTVYRILDEQKYSMKANRKTEEGKEDHPDRDKQFQFINDEAKRFQAENLPVLSIDTKKKENLGNFKNNGKEWSKKGEYTGVLTHDFPDKELGKVSPYGIYDVHKNEGWISVGISSDTAEFAVNSIRNWYTFMGKEKYPEAKRILLTADCGGSNSYRSKLWKHELQKLSNELQLEISVSHFPPGTSKWNKIEHRLFSQISQNWRGRPLLNLETVVELIGNTKTTTGLTVKVIVDKNNYETGRKISDKELKKINMEKSDFHGEWNYTIKPN